MQKSEEEESSEIKILAKNTAILASPKVLIFFLGMLKSKFIAVFLGTTGFGIVDQLTSTLNFIRQSTLSFLPDGMVKLIAKEKSEDFNHNLIGSIIKTYFYMLVPLILIVFLLALIFADNITVFVFGDIKYKNFFLIGLVAIPISFIGMSIASFLKAFKEVKVIATKEITIFVINFLIFIPLVYFYKILGGVYSVTLSFIVSFTVNSYLVNKFVFRKYRISYKKIYNSVFSKKYFKELLTFISVGILGGTFRVFENMASRAIVVNELGVEKIGTYAPISKWESLFIGFILPAVYTYLYPRLSESKSDKEITMVVNDVIRMITFLTLPFVIAGISTREWIIPLFYSDEFLEAAIYLPYHFSFLLTLVWWTIFEQIFAATGRLKIFLVFLVLIYSSSFLMVYYFVPKYGLYGYLLKFTVTPLVTLLTFFIYFSKEIRFRLKRENTFIVLYAIFCSFLMVVFKDINYYYQMIIGGFLIISMIAFLKKSERDFILNKLKITKK